MVDRRGVRRSASISTVRYPATAYAAARFALTNDLPSPAVALVMSIVGCRKAAPLSSMPERRLRAASLSGERGPDATAR